MIDRIANHDLTIREAAHLAGVTMRRIEKSCEEGIVPKAGRRPGLTRGTHARVPAPAAAYAAAMSRLDGITMAAASKRAVWKSIHSARGDSLGTVELSPGVKLELDTLAGDVWSRTGFYLAAREAFLVSDPKILGGEPVIRGTRITCRSVLGRVEGGDTVDDLTGDYPDVPREAFEAAALYARTHPKRGRPEKGKPWRKPE